MKEWALEHREALMTQDDARQAARATRLIDRELSAGAPGFVSLLVLVELCWVLKRLYAATEDELRETAQGLLDMPQPFGAHEPEHALLAKVQSAPKAKVAGVMEQFLAKAGGGALNVPRWAARSAGRYGRYDDQPGRPHQRAGSA